MVDSGAAINMISKELCDHLGLLMLAATEYNIRLVKGPLSELDSVVDKVSIQVGGIAHKVSFFVMTGANYHYILGQLFKMLSGIKLIGTSDRIDGPEYAELYNLRKKVTVRM